MCVYYNHVMIKLCVCFSNKKRYTYNSQTLTIYYFKVRDTNSQIEKRDSWEIDL